MGQDQFGIAEGEGGGTREAGARVWWSRHYGLGKRQKGVNEDIETGNDLVGGLKAEPAPDQIFPGTRLATSSLVRISYHLVGLSSQHMPV